MALKKHQDKALVFYFHIGRSLKGGDEYPPPPITLNNVYDIPGTIWGDTVAVQHNNQPMKEEYSNSQVATNTATYNWTVTH